MDKPRILYTPFLGHLRIATDAHAKMLRYIEEHRHHHRPEHMFELTAQGQATVVVVFAVTALECFIYGYAARRLGEGYSERHIEKLDLISKWIIVPKLVCGKEIRSDHKGIEMLGRLVKARNHVVHLKGKNLKLESWKAQTETIMRHDRDVLQSAASAFRCVGELGSELQRLDPDEPGAELLAEFMSTPDYQIKDEEN